MKCPYCGHEKHRVITTRQFDTCVLRVRMCSACLAVWKTVEESQLETPVIHRTVTIYRSEGG